MTLSDLALLALGVLLLSLILMGLYTRRFCQNCDYCGRFYWWIGWTAFEWTSSAYETWAMRCKNCQWLSRHLQIQSKDLPRV